MNAENNPPLEKLSPLLREATIADNGKLTPPHQALNAMLPGKSTSNSLGKKTVLLLGSGMVAGPLVEHLMSRPDVKIVVGKFINSFNSFIINLL